MAAPLTTRIDGTEYSLDEFVHQHPGGREMLLLAVNRDATGMFHSYHRNMQHAQAKLKLLPVVSKPSIPPAPEIDRFDFNSKLYDKLRTRVNTYFRDAQVSSSRGSWMMLFKSLLLVALWAASYWFSLQYTILCPVVGVLSASLGLCIQHDANHGALSSVPFVNTIFGFFDDVIGGSGLMWRHQHCVGHHVFCNDIAKDNDTKSQFPLMRLNPELPARSYLRYQHLYAPLLYSVLGVSYPWSDLWAYFCGAYFDIALHPLALADHAIFLLGKAVHFGLFLIFPFLSFGCEFSMLWRWYLPTQLFGGLWLAAVFAVSHNNTACEHNCTVSDWAELQIRTSANWAPDSLLWNWASGGLNCQIEHHLFPGICHTHYPAISKIVRQVCLEEKIPYNAFGTFGSILSNHFEFLYKMGNEDHRQ